MTPVPGKAERMARRDVIRLLRAVLNIKLMNCLSLEFPSHFWYRSRLQVTETKEGETTHKGEVVYLAHRFTHIQMHKDCILHNVFSEKHSYDSCK